MAYTIGGTTVIDNDRKGTFNTMNIGVFTTSTRPASPSPGDVIFNSTIALAEYWTGSEWRTL